MVVWYTIFLHRTGFYRTGISRGFTRFFGIFADRLKV